MTRVVLDANVYVSAILKPRSKPAKIVDLVKEGELGLLISLDILSEIRRVLLYPQIRKRHQRGAAQVDGYLASLAKIATVTPGKVTVDVVKNDPEDNKYLECAIEGEADFIISGDRHLKDLESFQGIPIVDSAAFLKLIAKEDEN